MSEQTDNQEEQAEAESSEPRCGELLAEARREQQITVLEVAKELHLDELKVRALERNERRTAAIDIPACEARRSSEVAASGVDKSR